MGLARYWSAQTLTSNAFRLVAWIFLRVIPSPKLMRFIPALYALYLGTWISTIFSPAKSHPTMKLKKPETTTAEGSVAKDSLPNGDTKAAVSSPPPHGTLSTVTLSLPTSSLSLRCVALLINTMIFLCTIDFVTHPTREPATSLIFTRVGAVDPDGAKIAVRWPEADQGAIRVVWREAPSGAAKLNVAWKNGPVIKLHNETDWVGVGRIGRLWPSTTYQYRLAYKNSTHLPYPEEPISFRTFPDPRLTTGSHFKFVVSSCMMPNFPYMAFKGDRIKGFDLLSDYIWSSPITPAPVATDQPDPIAKASPEATVKDKVSSNEGSASSEVTSTVDKAKSNDSASVSLATAIPAPLPDLSTAVTEFMLLLGDFVYAEVPSYGGDNVESYRRLYRRAYASPSFRKVYERLPIFNIYDDHEIMNNFVGQSNASTEPFPNAESAYSSYNGQANYEPLAKGGNYYEFRYGDVAFFVLDTRLYRTGVVTQEGEKTSMLGERQLSALYGWLDRVNTTTTFKFIISSVPFTSLWSHDAQVDSWAGYLDERDALLNILGTIPNVFVLSGDRHEFAAIEFLGGKVVEFSTSPLSMFYIPIVRTLRSHSKALVERLVQKVDFDETGQEVSREELELVPKEKVLKYLPLGNYKWSTFEINTTDRQKPTLNLEVVINGRPEWRYTIIGEPVRLKVSSTLGTQISQGLKGALRKIGLSPTKWF